MEDREVVLAVDLHSHSRKKNIFMYGCSGKGVNRLKERIFPRLLEKTAETFSFADCSFAIQRSKENTMRVVLFREFGLANTYTLEASFCGADYGRHADFHFNTEHYQEIGHNFCEALLDFCDPDQTKVKNILEELEALYPRPSDSESEDSDSEDSELSDEENNKKPKKKKNKKTTSVKKKL